eukprot:SAG11_NODE_16895_length_534_cov_0.829885_1_plen_61_part_01
MACGRRENASVNSRASGASTPKVHTLLSCVLSVQVMFVCFVVCCTAQAYNPEGLKCMEAEL